MNWKRFIPFIRPNGVAEKPLIDRQYVEDSLAASPVPIVLIITLLWAATSVLLLLSENNQRDLSMWTAGQQAPFSLWARTTFSYTDTAATAQAQQAVREKEPWIYRINSDSVKQIRNNIDGFFATLSEKGNKEFIPGSDNGSLLAQRVVNHQELRPQIEKNRHVIDEKIAEFFVHGFFSTDAAGKIPANHAIHVITPDEITYKNIPVRDSKSCALELAAVMEISQPAKDEFVRDMAELLAPGILIADQAATAANAERAAMQIPPVIKTRMRGELLIDKKQLITGETLDMINAEMLALPSGYGLALLGNQLLFSFILMMGTLFMLYRTYPKLFKKPRRFTICGLAVIMSLLANYLTMQLFFQLFRQGILPSFELVLFMIPIPFGAALLAILLGGRTSLIAGFLLSAITALMLMPDRAFELALRWYAVTVLMALLIRNISNYRSFFFRVFICGALLTALAFGDVIYTVSRDMFLLKKTVLILFCNSFACAIASLLAVFAFELFFNTDTSMSLMVLSDYNHPLLEKLKREAPGTMFHSMTVATLAEDAAKAIKANPIRAKAGALFHDIGKLSMPMYFVENNVDSPAEYLKMPPQRSCGIIRGHVKEGLNFAREYHLCAFIREAIATHHGDDLISFFYRLAKENNPEGSPPLLESQFRYDGEPPVGKELTIISLADACEAACRSLNKPSPAKIETMVNEIFLNRMRGGQLRNSELTTRELNIVRECFIADLISSNHGRIAYQKENSDDSTAQPVAEPPVSGTEKK